MTTAHLVLSALVIFTMVAILFWLSVRSRASKRAISMARSMARQVFPVWAAQGPFASGAESAAAMRNAYMVVMGPEQTEAMADAIAEHAAAFDHDPATWQETRRDAAQAAVPQTADFVWMAKRAGAKDAMNDACQAVDSGQSSGYDEMTLHPTRELTKAEAIKDAWGCGQQARIVGMEETDCPFNHNPILHAAWRKGWREYRPSREFWARVSPGERTRQMKRYGIEVDRGIGQN
jgi:ribosome modulation factor